MEWIPKQRVKQVNNKFKKIVVKSDQQHSNMSLVDESVVPLCSHAPIVSSYNDRIRPLLDAIDKLRNLKVMQEGIQLPTIVVVGDQSSGKSSVLESLAGISLPRGQGICTRVPLIMRLHHHSKPESELHLEYCGKVVSTDEMNIAEAINMATTEIAGNGKGISHTPLTLVVKKNGVPDLTMVDLPGITRVPVHGQPQNIYEQISGIIMEYIKPEESIILNVLSATVDFPTCESIRMSQSVDKTGDRTLAVVTKSDKSPEGLRDKVMADDVNIGLGYVCVRNRIGDESYEEARMAESMLFESHALLSKIDKSMVSVPVLARKLVQIQATIISKCLPEIVRKINGKLNGNVLELNNLPQKLSSVAEAITAFMRILGLSKESLKKLLVRGEFDEYPENKNMHCTARLAEMLDKFSRELKDSSQSDPNEKFLLSEIFVLEETKSVALPNFLPRSAFLSLLQYKVKRVSNIPVNFVAEVWDYIETVVVNIMMHHCDNYPPLQSSTKRAVLNLISKMKEQSTSRVMEIIEMEEIADYTCDPEYMAMWSKLMTSRDAFKAVFNGVLWIVNIEALTAFMRILGLSRESLKKLLLRGEFDEYPDNKNMHSTARLAEMLDKFSHELKKSSPIITDEKFLLDEIFVLEETKSVALPNFLPRSAFLHLLQLKVQAISEIPVSFVAKVWDYIETVVVEIMMHHCENYPPLQSSTKRAALDLISKMKEQSTYRVLEIIEMEKLADYTCDPEYMALWRKLMKSHDKFKEAIDGDVSWIADIESFGKIDVRHLDDYPGVRDVAFDLKMRLTAYWNIVLKRMVDSIALYLLMALKKLVNQGMEEEIVNEVLGPQGGGIECLMDESPSFTIKRARLNQSIGLLKESRDVLAKIIDRIAIAVD